MTNIRNQCSIVNVSTYGMNDGGAGKAAFRLHKGLLQIGQKSKYLLKAAQDPDPSVFVMPWNKEYEKQYSTDGFINQYYIFLNRTARSNTLFSFSYPGYDIATHPVVGAADIINLHWVEHFLSPASLHALFLHAKPCVWTLHDQKPFTGGCHYSAGCNHYEDSCLSCPQLSHDPLGLPNAVLADKRDLFRGADLTIVAPSSWLAREAKKSSLFKSNRIEVIPNAVDTNIYFPVDKAEAKQAIGIDPRSVTIMFGTVDAAETRKGLQHLLHAVDLCLRNPGFRTLLESRKIEIICVGNTDPAIKSALLPFRNLGYIDSDDKMAGIYRASDLFVLPSLEDNLPNTMLEAMACATPVIAFNIGGIPDVVADGQNGRLIEYKNDVELGRAIFDLIANPQKRKFLGEQAGTLIQEKYKLGDQANKYLRLYKELLKTKKRTPIAEYDAYYGRNTKRIYNELLRHSVQNALRLKSRLAAISKNEYIASLLYYSWYLSVKFLPRSFYVQMKSLFLKQQNNVLPGR